MIVEAAPGFGLNPEVRRSPDSVGRAPGLEDVFKSSFVAGGYLIHAVPLLH